jgi:hypothetical protein
MDDDGVMDHGGRHLAAALRVCGLAGAIIPAPRAPVVAAPQELSRAG